MMTGTRVADRRDHPDGALRIDGAESAFGTPSEPVRMTGAAELGSYRELAAIARQHGSPFYFFDRDAFIRNVRAIRAAFRKRYPHTLVGYSYKTNYIPYLCRLARDLGSQAEVVSRLELDLAIRIGCPPEEIIFNGPVKTAEDIAFALNAGVLVNVDSLRELEFVTDLARQTPGKPVRIGLRINVSLVDETGASQLQNGLSAGRFGLSEDGLVTAKGMLSRHPEIQVCSLHGHTSSATRSLWVYRTITARLVDVAARHFRDSIDYINVGGGFYGRPVPEMGLIDTPSYDDYAGTICEVLNADHWVASRKPHLVIEPGMAVTADTLSFVTRVFEVKRCGDRHLAVVDGSIFNVKPTLHRHNHPFTIVGKEDAANPGGRYSIVGATCMEKDCLLQEVDCVELRRGDFVRIDNVGAYTVVLTPPFIHPAPPVLVRAPQGYVAIRRRQNFDDVFGSYLF